MPPPQQGSSLAGSFRLFHIAGISVYMHWSWFVIGYLLLQFRGNAYEHWAWNVAEYVTLFAIVLLHEFGHALACRQVGGQANEIVLWPLGGIAFVSPPPRPGALLWSIAAGPLVNVALVPVTAGAFVLADSGGLQEAYPDAYHFVLAVMVANLFVFGMNMLPIYPLDGGQILQALLWFIIGRSSSLLVVSVLGLFTTAAVIVLAAFSQAWWFVVLAVFAAIRCWAGFQQARLLAQLENAPRHRSAECPSCGAHPLKGPFWACGDCQTPFDMFVHQAQCPGCGKQFHLTKCPECGRSHPLWAWYEPGEKTEMTERAEREP